jgi:hypothetical protein
VIHFYLILSSYFLFNINHALLCFFSDEKNRHENTYISYLSFEKHFYSYYFPSLIRISTDMFYHKLKSLLLIYRICKWQDTFCIRTNNNIKLKKESSRMIQQIYVSWSRISQYTTRRKYLHRVTFVVFCLGK